MPRWKFLIKRTFNQMSGTRLMPVHQQEEMSYGDSACTTKISVEWLRP
jgi:hypothetical protein